MLGTIFLHELGHRLHELLLMVRIFHIDEVDNDNPADIAQSQLPGNFFCSLHIDIEDGFSLVSAGHFVTTVDIDHVHSFRMLDDNISTAAHSSRFSKRRLDLSGYTESFENGFGPLVQLQNANLVRSYGGKITFDVAKQLFIIDNNAREGIAQQIAEDRGGFVEFAQQLLRRLYASQLIKHILPFFRQEVHFLMKFSYFAAFSSRTYDDAKIFRFDAFNKQLQAFPFFSRGYFFGNSHRAGKRR